jgi:hypothetical protein
MKLSAHFIANWRDRVGGDPTELLVREVIKRSVRLQGAKAFDLADGNMYKRLALFWQPDLELVLFVDTIDQVAVSVLSRRNYEEKFEGKKEKIWEH